MSKLIWNITGYDEAPIAQLEANFRHIANKEMQNLPFYRQHIPIKAVINTLFDKQWIGAILTPWMLELIILPGPNQEWPYRKIGERLALALPCGEVKFVVGELADGMQYLACSLMSPLNPHLDAEHAIQLAENSAKMALSFPVHTQSTAEIDLSRRSLFRGQLRS
ncbi:hydrogenase-2 assembly chaperone [Proteus myxofaciens]|uniref:HybE family protein n=1 Tax=Proteus myxofaciens ATCC 19692 TaxID=1354337 RepID=A0A198FLM7_9GAMM|nr:hydrogenase-2 assembly chaperone [Proteus myxofaciens]OAT25852.1 HybE family protein [Proteus myxofaciens ATCC 19692]